MIKFGTSGWRDIIAEGFTYQGVRIVSQAIVDLLEAEGCSGNKQIIIGYDTRFMSEDFAKASAEIFAGNGFEVHYSIEDVPTPTIAYEIIRSGACGGINITASHNPYRYSGIKFSPAWGGPALPETTKEIESNCLKIEKDLSVIKRIHFADAVKDGIIKKKDFKEDYLKRIEELINIKAIKESGIRVAVDVMNGAGRGYLDTILQYHGVPTLALNTNRDPFFRGHHPEPSAECLGDAIEFVKEDNADLAVATDGDADRFGIIDKDGSYITANEIVAVLLYHLVKHRGYSGIAARSVMTSSFIDAVAEEYGIELRETPVGFKFIGDILVKENLLIGGEESGGLTIKDHVPEKDGVLACLLVIEMVAMFGKSIKAIIKELEDKVGKFYNDRANYRLRPDVMERVKRTLASNPPQQFGDFKVNKIITLDGYKFIFDNKAWLGIRLSGTEPVIRCYAETKSQEALEALLKAGDELINSI
ncbi:MAG: phosphoglucomutase/phosphomannomutase family protein [bacterium]|nr:phosphoglucomutase/phosphomannomutase family protein [bacterium]